MIANRRRNRSRARVWLAAVADGVRTGDQAEIARAVEEMSRSRRFLAPLAVTVGGVAMLFGGVKMLFSNWRLTLVQLLPAMWIWLAMYDLRAHVLHDRSFHSISGPVLIPVILTIVALTVLAFFLNAVFGYAISQPGVPKVGQAFREARERPLPILVAGIVIGIALGVAAVVLTRSERPWFALSLGIVVGAMMVAYVAVPSRLLGVAKVASKRDRIVASAIGGVLGVAVSTPPYVLGRIGLLMIGSPILRIPGILLFALGVTLQAGATSAAKAVKMTAKLRGGQP